MTSRIVVILTFSLLFWSCSVKRKANTGSDDVKLTDKQRFNYEYTFLEAHRAKLTGDFDKAAVFFLQCIKINPKSDASHYELSSLYFAFDDIETAIKYAKNAIAIDRFNKWYYFQLARLYQANNQLEKSVEVYRDLIKIFPEENEFKITLAGLLGETNRITEAVSILDEIEKQIGVTEKVTLTKHNLFVKNGNFERAFTEIQKLIAAVPDDLKYHGILAELYSKLGMDRQAMETYKLILNVDPDYTVAHLSIADFFRSRGMFEESFVHYAKAFRDEAINIGEKISAIVLFFDPPEVLSTYKVQIGQLVELIVAAGSDVTQARLVAADFFLRTENMPRAIVELKALSKMVPDNYPVMEQLLISLSYQAEYDEIIHFGSLAILKFPEKGLIHYFMGVAYYQTGNYEKAAVILEKGLQISDLTPDMRVSFSLLLGDTFNKLGEFEKSDSKFMKVLEEDPDNTIAMNNWAYYLALREEMLEKAEAMSRKTIEKEPGNSTYLDTYAWIMYKMGEYEKALYYIELAMKFIEEENSEILDHYGDILFKKGRTKEAIEMWKRAYQSDNSRKEIIEKIEKYEEL